LLKNKKCGVQPVRHHINAVKALDHTIPLARGP